MNKRIVYLLFDNIHLYEKGGINNKVNGQVKAFEKNGFHVDLVSFKKKNELFFNSEKILKIPSKILFFKFLIFNRIINEITNQAPYEFIYIRYFLSSFSFILFLKKIKKSGIKVILEFPTFPYDNEIDAKNVVVRINVFIDKITRRLLKRFVYLCVCPTYKDDIFNIPTVKIENGITVEGMKIVEPKDKKHNRIELIGVANLSVWHGYDRILSGMGSYYNQSGQDIEVFFTIIGNGSELAGLKKLSNELNIDKYVHFTGALTGVELDAFFNKADIAVASLGLHRIGLTTGSTLKASEYMARGLPVIFSYDDEAIPATLPFVMKAGANDEPVETNQIIAFFEDMDSPPEMIRNYAKDNLDWEVQMSKVISRI